MTLQRALVGITLVWLGTLAGTRTWGQEVAAPSERRIIAYLFGRADIPNIGAEKLTHINYSFARVDDDGRMFLPGDRSPGRLAELNALKSRNPQLKIVLSVGGWGADGFSDAALTEESRHKFAESGVALVEQHHLDGLDIDWEYPGQRGPGIKYRPEDKQNFTLMLAELRRQLDEAGLRRWPKGDDRYVLTIASAGGNYYRNVEMDRIHQHLDWINIMTYDLYGGDKTRHHTGLFPAAGEDPGAPCVATYVAQHLAAGISPGKLVIGAAFYGHGWSGVESANNGLGQPFEKTGGGGGYAKLVRDFIDKNGYVRHWDEAARAPYLWNATSGSFITYDDSQSLAEKSRFVKERGLGGIMYWEYSDDADEQLLDAVVEGLR